MSHCLQLVSVFTPDVNSRTIQLMMLHLRQPKCVFFSLISYGCIIFRMMYRSLYPVSMNEMLPQWCCIWVLGKLERNRHRSLQKNQKVWDFHNFGSFTIMLHIAALSPSCGEVLQIRHHVVFALIFFHMVSKDPSLICWRWLWSKAPVKQLSSRWIEQITKRVFGWGWKLFLFVLTNRVHASLVFL